jgi:TetR/AcrR family transcriptional regulator
MRRSYPFRECAQQTRAEHSIFLPPPLLNPYLDAIALDPCSSTLDKMVGFPYNQRVKDRGTMSSGNNNGDGRRERIIQQALRLFAEKGYDGASTPEIARLAGVSQSLIYRHFKNKDGLWKGVLQSEVTRLEENFVPPAFDGTDMLAYLGVFARGFVHFNADFVYLVRMVQQEALYGGPRLEWALDVLFRKYIGLLEMGIAMAQSEGLLAPLPAANLALIWLGAANHMHLIPAIAKEIFEVDAFDPKCTESYAETFAHVMLHGMVLSGPEDNTNAMAPPNPPVALRVVCLERSQAFYRKLSFIHLSGDDGHILMQRGEDRLYLCTEGRCTATGYRVIVKDAEAICKQLQADKLQILLPLKDQPWGMREFTIADPDGHLVTFASLVNP